MAYENKHMQLYIFTEVTDRNISYYNAIAGSYDSLMDSNEANRQTRKFVEDAFRTNVTSGTILDFGGGTGEDLQWLLPAGYAVVFCEPSTEMRKKAKEKASKLKGPSPEFLEDDAVDFNHWSETLPFPAKVNAVLCNFAVVNCIAEPRKLFHAFSLVTEPGARIFLLLLKRELRKRLRADLYTTLASFLSGRTISYTIEQEGQVQEVYLHSVKEIKKSARPYFVVGSQKESGGFILLELLKQ